MAIYPWQQDIWRQLNAERQRLPHALLFQGRKGVGKLDFARALAHGLLCETPRESGEACGTCSACGWLAQGNHPDFRTLEPESLSEDGEPAEGKGKKASRQIRIEQVRDLEGLVNLSTHRNGMRVILVHPAEAMNQNAANALLKTLEEPPPRTLFILVSHQPQVLLPTVRSRCRKLAFPIPGNAQALDWMRRQGIADPAPFLAQAGYAPLAAAELVSEERREARRGFLIPLSRPQTLDAIGLAEKSEKVDLADALRWLQQWVYDMIAWRLTGRIRYNEDYSNEIISVSGTIKVQDAISYQKELLLAQKHLHHPLNAQLLLEQLLLSYMLMMNRSVSGHG